MKIVVTGALGHIGSYIIRQIPLSFPKAEIILVDNLITQRFGSLFNLPDLGSYKFIQLDVAIDSLDSILENADVAIHLAAITDAAGSFDRQEELENNNFVATKNVALSCLKNGVKLICLSSTSVYGTQNSLVSENCTLDELKPQSPYAVTKLKEEDFVRKLCSENSLNAVICRFGTIYGVSPGMRFHTAVNKFCWQSVMGLPITVWSTAYDQKRPYLDLIDAYRAFDFIIKNNIFDGEVYNILTGNHTVRDIINAINSNIADIEISFVENQIMNQLSYEVENVKFKNKGFEFKGDLNIGIRNTINLLASANRGLMV
jgi:UDP-glucose 4-epimerase